MEKMIAISSDSDDGVVVISSEPGSPTKLFTPTKRNPDDEEDVGSPSLKARNSGDEEEMSSSSVKKRLKLERDSSECEESSPSHGVPQQVEYFDGDLELPLMSQSPSGYPVHSLIQSLLADDVDPDCVCKVQPLGVMKNAAFMIDLDKVHFSDLKADDLGSWKATGTKRTHFRFTQCQAIRYTSGKPHGSTAAEYFLLTRRYYVHHTYDRFHRIISDIRDHNGAQNKYCMLQYYFDGPQVEVQIKPHGNAKSSTPFFRTSDSARLLHREIAIKHEPKDAIYLATQQQGGEIQARGMSSLPRNRQQIANYRRTEHKRGHNVLYSVMLECKVAQGSQDAFVRDVKAAPDPECVLFFDWQLEDMERFLTRSDEFGILTVDTTYNLGQFYVTPTTYPHLMLEDISTRKHPAMLGPVLVHQRMNFASFNYFANTLVGFNKNLRNIRAFGTDGQESMIEAFSHCFPLASQLRCFIHFKNNVVEKLKEYGIPSVVSQEFVADIFGKYSGSTYEEGLVDAISPEDFHARLENCKRIWDERETPYAPSSGPRFYNYFCQYKAKQVCHTMRRDLREATGLGSPPEIFTTNASESINAMLKRKVDYKESEWPAFNEKVKQLAKQQREEVIRSLSTRGQYRLLPHYSHFATATTTWAKMRPEQRRDVVKRFDQATLKSKRSVSSMASHNQPSTQMMSTAAAVSGLVPTSTDTETLACSQSVNPSVTPMGSRAQITFTPPSCNASKSMLSVSAGASGITKLSLTTVQHMWEKAEKLLSMDNAITCAPGNNSKAKMVMSYSSDMPHLVRQGSKGQYQCDDKCINWSTSGICSHSLAVAELNHDLDKFLQWYNTEAAEPNLTSLAFIGLPSGRGRKGGIARRKCTLKGKTPIECVKQRQATVTPSSTSQAPANYAVTSLFQQQNTTASMPPIPSTPEALTFVSCASGASPSIVQLQVPQMNTSASSMSSVFQINPHASIVSQQPTISPASQPVALTTAGMPPFPPPNVNPFYVKFISGNIRVCQGCKGSLRSKDYSVPTPPFDLVISRAERRQFRDSNGILVTPRSEQAVHYHLNIHCVRAVEPTFVPQSLKIPPDILPKLTAIHREFLKLVFQVPNLQ